MRKLLYLKSMFMIPTILFFLSACTNDKPTVDSFLSQQKQVSEACTTAAADTYLYLVTPQQQEMGRILVKVSANNYTINDIQRGLAVEIDRRAKVLDKTSKAIKDASQSVTKLTELANSIKDSEIRIAAVAIAKNYDEMLAASDKIIIAQNQRSAAVEQFLNFLLGQEKAPKKTTFTESDDEQDKWWKILQDKIGNEKILLATFNGIAKRRL